MFEPLQLNFYKGVGGRHGAIQFRFSRPHWFVKSNSKLKNYEGRFIYDSWLKEFPNLTTDDLASREGAVFLEIASAVDKNVYDWENKISMALSITDLGKLIMVLSGLEKEIKIMHDPGAKSERAGQVKKYLNMSSPQGIKAGVMITVAMSDSSNDKQLKHTVPLSGDEVAVLACCIRSIIPACIAWA